VAETNKYCSHCGGVIEEKEQRTFAHVEVAPQLVEDKDGKVELQERFGTVNVHLRPCYLGRDGNYATVAVHNRRMFG
jgi:hypothetical protein